LLLDPNLMLRAAAGCPQRPAQSLADNTVQWLTEEHSRTLPADKREAVGAEVADVLLYLIQLANALGIDPIAAAQAKLKLNELKYPVERARGNRKKYNEL
jgi:NTP pyrophosphatase (non-canonical NTP hydrolase)